MKRKKMLGILVALAGVGTAYTLLAIRPGLQKLRTMRESLAAEQLHVSAAVYLPQQIEALQAEVELATKYRLRWRKNAPQDAGLAEFYRRLTADAELAGVAVVTIRPQGAVLTAPIREIPVELQCSGTFAGLSEFLKRLEEAPESISIETLKMQPTGEDGQSIRCDLRLTVFGESSDISD